MIINAMAFSRSMSMCKKMTKNLHMVHFSFNIKHIISVQCLAKDTAYHVVSNCIVPVCFEKVVKVFRSMIFHRGESNRERE